MVAPFCPYCGQVAVLLISSAKLYRGTDYGAAWACPSWPECDSYVGCHPGTTDPLGRLANKELRRAKSKAHATFDPLWKNSKPKKGARGRGYRWLAQQLGIEPADCHIGMFDVETCQRVVKLCQPYYDRIRRKKW